MKIIFDFDDVLFNNALFKIKLFSYFESRGITKEEYNALYIKHRSNFSLEKMYTECLLCIHKPFIYSEFQEFHDYILSDLDAYVNKELLTLIEKAGKENCFLLTAGDAEFQFEKIEATGILSYIENSHITVVKNDKTESLVKLCKEYDEEYVIFVDDNETHVDKAKALSVPNLHTVMYDITRSNYSSSEVIKMYSLLTSK